MAIHLYFIPGNKIRSILYSRARRMVCTQNSVLDGDLRLSDKSIESQSKGNRTVIWLSLHVYHQMLITTSYRKLLMSECVLMCRKPRVCRRCSPVRHISIVIDIHTIIHRV